MAGYSPSVNIVLTNPSKVKDRYPLVAFSSASECVEVLPVWVQSYRNKSTLFSPNSATVSGFSMSFYPITSRLVSAGTNAGAIPFSQPLTATTWGSLIVITQSPNVLKQYFAWISKVSMIFSDLQPPSSSKDWGKPYGYREQDAISQVSNDFAIIIDSWKY